MEEESDDTAAENIPDLEHSRTAIEVAQIFDGHSNYFFSYILRTLAELALASCLLAWLLLTGTNHPGGRNIHLDV